MLLNLTQAVHLLANWVVFASNLGKLEDSRKFVLACADRDELAAFLLLAVAAAFALLLPLLDAWLTVDSSLAEAARDWLLGLGKDHISTNNADGVGVKAQLFKIIFINEALL